MIDEILKRYGLKYEQLEKNEKETLHSWLDALEKNKISVTIIREYIQSMKDAVENKITTTKNNSKQDLFLKARLRNYLLLEAFLTTPEKAKKQLENAISTMAKRTES